jgi:glycosyltransferase involved in cell wall biosynthesis
MSTRGAAANARMTKPRITVGLPVYNASARIADCLNSVLEQCFEDFVLIVSDNASDDGTPEIVEQFAARDSRIRFFRQPMNMGLMANFQFVLQQCETPLFCWRADDDGVSSNYLEQLVGTLNRHENCYLAVPTVRIDRAADGSQQVFPIPDCVPQAHEAQLAAVLELMPLVQPSWFYGVWRTNAARAAFFESVQNYGQVHAVDLLVLFAAILDRAICGDPAAIFRLNIDSRDRKKDERPVTFADRISTRERAFLPFLHAARAHVSARRFTPQEMRALKPALLEYTRRHVGCSEWKFFGWQLRKALLGGRF